MNKEEAGIGSDKSEQKEQRSVKEREQRSDTKEE